MSKVVIYLWEHEHTALSTLAHSEYRTLRAQAARIIRKELVRLAMIEPEVQPNSIIHPSPLLGTEDIGG